MTNSFTISTYNPSDVTLVVAGYVIAGWDTISITRRTDSFKPVAGIRGKHARVRTGGSLNPDTSAIITLTLAQESQSNDVLSAIHELDITEGTGRIVLTLKDKSGGSLFNSHEAYILSYPESVFTNDFSGRQWRIFCQSTKTYFVGGNTKPQTSLLDSATSFVSGLF